MKFFNKVLITLFALLNLISIISSKFRKRNYSKISTDPSYNPLPKNWSTGPRNAFGGGHNYNKYKHYSSRLANYHNYHDTTAQLRHIVKGN